MPTKEKDNSIFVSLICNILLVLGKGIAGINFMLLVLNRIEKPDSTSVVVAFIALAVYGGCINIQKAMIITI